MRPGGQRAKGHAFERKVANDLKAIFPGAKRGFQTRGGGKEQCDVEGTPFAIECKHMKKPDHKGAYIQACEDGLKRTPVAIIKQNRSEPVVYISFNDLVKLSLHNGYNPLVCLSYEDWLAMVAAEKERE